MRSDAKVGLVCVLGLAVAVIGYFEFQGKSSAKPAPPLPAPVAAADQHSSPSESLSVAPPQDTATPPQAPATPPAAFATLAQAAPMVSPPASAPASSLYPGGNAAQPILPPVTPGLDSGQPASAPSVGPATPGHGRTEIEPASRPHDDLTESHADALPGEAGAGHPSIPGAARDRTEGEAVPGAGLTADYTIQKGDVLSTIARKNHVTLAALKAANPGINYDALKIKQVIKIPPAGSGVSAPPPPATRPASTRSGTSHMPSTRPAASHAIAAGSTYKVKKGDTLRKIALAAYGKETLWRNIYRANRGQLDDPDDLEVGMVLKIPAK